MSLLPNPYTPTIMSADFKANAYDFIVEELLTIDLTGEGEHLWLHLKKIHLNTAYVAKLLAKWADIPAHDVSYSGLKDRHAVTTQWFSLRLPKKIAPSTNFVDFAKNWLNTEEKIDVLATHWHNKKLQRGTHQANHFVITLRNVQGEKSAIDQQLTQIQSRGIPNYFGEQRFGQDDGNILTALEFFATGRIHGRKAHPKFNRDKISLYLSAARSELFNAVLAKRVALDKWDVPLTHDFTGEVVNLSGSNSFFTVTHEDNPIEIATRLATHDIGLTAPMWGAGELASAGDVAELEQSVVASDERYQQLAQGLEKQGLRQQRRAMWLLPKNLTWQWMGDDSLQLNFDLPSGSFATSVVAMLMV